MKLTAEAFMRLYFVELQQIFSLFIEKLIRLLPGKSFFRIQIHVRVLERTNGESKLFRSPNRFFNMWNSLVRIRFFDVHEDISVAMHISYLAHLNLDSLFACCTYLYCMINNLD